MLFQLLFSRAGNCAALCAFALAGAVPAFAQIGEQTQAVAAPREMSARLEAIVAQRKVPGLAAVVLQGDRIVAQGVAGVRRAGAPERLTLDDRFLLCSGGKAMTATLVARSIEEGKLSWDTTLADVFPERVERMHPAWRTATVAQLLQHRAGAPGDGARVWTLLRAHFSRASVEEKRRSVVEKTLARAPVYPPGSRYGYATIDYLMLGEMLQKIHGRPWEELMRERLWAPAGIASGGFGAPGTPGRIDAPRGHWGMVMAGRPVEPGGFWARLNVPQFFGPAAAAHLTITDWAKFAALHLRGDPANPNHAARLLREETFATLHRSARGKFYEGGWILLTKPWAHGGRAADAGRVLSSQGDNGFWHVEAWLAPEIDFAVLIVCNQGGAAANKPAAQACGETLAAMIAEFAPKPARIASGL